jgi:hypothetical protein
MRTSFLTATLAVTVGVSALPQITPLTPLAPALPLDNFKTEKFTKLLSLEDVVGGLFKKIEPPTSSKLPSNKAEFHRLATSNTMATAASCSNPRVRVEWDNASNNDRQAYVSAIRCLMGKPASGQYRFAKSRYEDLVALHQILTPNVHGSSKFLLWHRYYLWTFEDVMRGECGFNGPLLWFDETKYSGRFDQSSIFSDQWFGGINAGGNCITNGVRSPSLCQHLHKTNNLPSNSPTLPSTSVPAQATNCIALPATTTTPPPPTPTPAWLTDATTRALTATWPAVPRVPRTRGATTVSVLSCPTHTDLPPIPSSSCTTPSSTVTSASGRTRTRSAWATSMEPTRRATRSPWTPPSTCKTSAPLFRSGISWIQRARRCATSTTTDVPCSFLFFLLQR